MPLLELDARRPLGDLRVLASIAFGSVKAFVWSVGSSTPLLSLRYATRTILRHNRRACTAGWHPMNLERRQAPGNGIRKGRCGVTLKLTMSSNAKLMAGAK
jgi:hypothetical protein